MNETILDDINICKTDIGNFLTLPTEIWRMIVGHTENIIFKRFLSITCRYFYTLCPFNEGITWKNHIYNIIEYIRKLSWCFTHTFVGYKGIMDGSKSYNYLFITLINIKYNFPYIKICFGIRRRGYLKTDSKNYEKHYIIYNLLTEKISNKTNIKIDGLLQYIYCNTFVELQKNIFYIYFKNNMDVLNNSKCLYKYRDEKIPPAPPKLFLYEKQFAEFNSQN